MSDKKKIDRISAGYFEQWQAEKKESATSGGKATKKRLRTFNRNRNKKRENPKTRRLKRLKRKSDDFVS